MSTQATDSQMTAAALAERLGAELIGDGTVQITGVASLDSARSGDLSFVADQYYFDKAATCKATALLVPKDFAAETTATVLRVDAPRVAFARALPWLVPPHREAPGVHPTAVVAPSATLGANVHVGAYVVIGEDVTIGADAVLHPHVCVYRGAKIGARSLLHAHAVVREHVTVGSDALLQPGAIVGADGFGHEMTPEGRWLPVQQVGTVSLGDHVEIGANACVDRGALDDTTVGDGTKIDNLVQVGHNCTIGEHNMICGQTGIAGSVTLGRHVVIGGHGALGGHLTIGDGAQLAGLSGVMADLEGGKRYAGIPARPYRRAGVIYAAIERLPEMVKQLKKLTKQVEALSAAAENEPDANA